MFYVSNMVTEVFLDNLLSDYATLNNNGITWTGYLDRSVIFGNLLYL